MKGKSEQAACRAFGANFLSTLIEINYNIGTIQTFIHIHASYT